MAEMVKTISQFPNVNGKFACTLILPSRKNLAFIFGPSSGQGWPELGPKINAKFFRLGRNLFNQDFRAAPVWSTSFGQIESGPGAFPDFSSWRALANSSEVKSAEISLSVGVGILQGSDTSLEISLADSRSFVL